MSTSELPPNAPAPRLCHLVKWADFDGYGFNLHAEKSRTGQFIGKVDDDSPAQYAGLREGDRIIEVNGVNIANENHRQVVERIKSVPNETRLLVVDEEADRWYKVMKYVVKSTQPNVEYMKTPVPRPSTNPPSYDNISSSPVNGVEKTSNGVEHFPALGNGVNGSKSSTPSGSPSLSLKANGNALHVEEELKDAKAIEKTVEDSPKIKSEEIPRVNEIEESVAINEPEESPKIMRNEESPKIMRNEESPKIMRNEESPKIMRNEESPKMMKCESLKIIENDKSPKIMKSGEESPKVMKSEESPKIIMEESPKLKSENSPPMKFRDEPGSSRSSTPLDGSGGSIPDSPHSTKSSRSSGGGSSQNGPASPDSALNLNMSASEMRQILAARKKRDPKKVQMDIMQKYEIIQQM